MCLLRLKSKTVLAFTTAPNPAVDPAPSGRWTLRDKAAQRRSPLRYATKTSGVAHGFKRSVELDIPLVQGTI
jgi:hypothetical protein